MTAKYLRDRCPHCGGHGIVSDYRGGDFNGPMDCRDCGGNGSIIVYASDRTAMWPGGPLTGSWPGRYKELAEGGRC